MGIFIQGEGIEWVICWIMVDLRVGGIERWGFFFRYSKVLRDSCWGFEVIFIFFYLDEVEENDQGQGQEFGGREGVLYAGGGFYVVVVYSREQYCGDRVAKLVLSDRRLVQVQGEFSFFGGFDFLGFVLVNWIVFRFKVKVENYMFLIFKRG